MISEGLAADEEKKNVFCSAEKRDAFARAITDFDTDTR